MGAERAAITIETLIAEAEAARSKAMGEKGGANAAVAAITAKAKLAGLWREKVAQTDPLDLIMAPSMAHAGPPPTRAGSVTLTSIAA